MSDSMLKQLHYSPCQVGGHKDISFSSMSNMLLIAVTFKLRG